jgi:hypothetical protein
MNGAVFARAESIKLSRFNIIMYLEEVTIKMLEPMPRTEASDDHESIVCGVPNPWRVRSLFAMLNAHFDESYGEGVYGMAGYVADVETWKRFSDEWKAVLDAYPHIVAFHMRDAERREDELAGLTDEQIAAKLEAFVQIVERHSKRMFGVMCFAEQDYLGEMFPIPSGADEQWWAHDTCVKWVIAFTKHERNKKGLRDRVQFIFDDGPMTEITRASLLRFRKEMDADREPLFAAPPQFEDDKEVVALQAADLVAWHLRRHSARRIEPEPGSVLARLMSPGFNEQGRLTRENLPKLGDLLQFVMGLGRPESIEDLRRHRDAINAKQLEMGKNKQN